MCIIYTLYVIYMYTRCYNNIKDTDKYDVKNEYLI